MLESYKWIGYGLDWIGLEISVGTDSNNKSAQRLLELCFIYLTQDSATAAIDSKTLEIKASTAER